MFRRPDTIQSLRKEIVDDSLVREKKLKKLLQLVREDERNKVLTTMGDARERASARS